MKHRIFNLLLLLFINYELINSEKPRVNPILDVDKSTGYHGKIGERNILVDLVPHLQIQNNDFINGICSYHVYKPNSEDFPFTIEIKNRDTGEAIIQLSQDGTKEANLNKLNCKKRRFYTFYIEAHDCSEPSLASEKVPVNIEIIDHNDFKLAFEHSDIYRTIVENEISKNFLMLSATDDDCTNEGNACTYKILEDNIPFTIDQLGFVSNTMPLTNKERYDFTVRAFDCLDKNSFTDAFIHVDVIEACSAGWTDYASSINSTLENNAIFENLQFSSCGQMDTCEIEEMTSVVKLELNSFPNGCEINKCGEVLGKTKLLSGLDSTNDDNDDTNEPTSYRTFSKISEYTEKSDFDGNFGKTFILKAWIRRNSAQSNEHEKEHVFCGTDSELQNRHHFGMYFYRRNIKFLLRKEHQSKQQQKTHEFYPSLWEWSIESFDNDGKWHLYEIKVDYPQVELFIDGVKFVENMTNSDIIDAYELDNIMNTGITTTYIGSCYHARSKTFNNFFEGDIADLSIYRTDDAKAIECIKNCKEYLEIKLNGNEDYTKSIENAQHNQITIQTNTLDAMLDLVTKINYVNKYVLPNINGKRFLSLSTNVKCLKLDSVITLDPVNIEINVQKSDRPKFIKQNIDIQLDGNTEMLSTVEDLSRGVLVFRDISINKIVNDNYVDEIESDLYLSKCMIRLEPFNSNNNLNEKFMYSENLNANNQYKFIDNANMVIIEGREKIENFEYFLKNLVYVYDIDLNDLNSAASIGSYRLFYLKCVRDDIKTETNTILIQVNITKEKSYVAFKSAHKFTAPGDSIIEDKILDSSNRNGLQFSSPVIVVLIVISAGLMGFMLAFAAFKIKSTRDRRGGLTNEENPQMEWDDSGLNIIENPMEAVEKMNNDDDDKIQEYDEYSSTEEDDSNDEENYNYDYDEGPEKILERELEWDDSTLEEIQMRNQKNISNNNLNRIISKDYLNSNDV